LQETSTVFATNGVLFKIWRDSTVIFSAYRSLFGSNSKTITSFNHVDSSFAAERHFNYYLTAELPTSGTAATVIGPITFTATEIDS
jgi:protein associated with RNAse G/E